MAVSRLAVTCCAEHTGCSRRPALCAILPSCLVSICGSGRHLADRDSRAAMPDIQSEDPLAIAKYRELAAVYDRQTARLGRYRQRAVQRLLVGSGDTVLDVACGTGANFSLLERCVGPRGHVIGIDISPEMLQVARHRAQRHGWQNIELIETSVDAADFDGEIDAALFS